MRRRGLCTWCAMLCSSVDVHSRGKGCQEVQSCRCSHAGAVMQVQSCRCTKVNIVIQCNSNQTRATRSYANVCLPTTSHTTPQTTTSSHPHKQPHHPTHTCNHIHHHPRTQCYSHSNHPHPSPLQSHSPLVIVAGHVVFYSHAVMLVFHGTPLRGPLRALRVHGWQWGLGICFVCAVQQHHFLKNPLQQLGGGGGVGWGGDGCILNIHTQYSIHTICVHTRCC